MSPKYVWPPPLNTAKKCLTPPRWCEKKCWPPPTTYFLSNNKQILIVLMWKLNFEVIFHFITFIMPIFMWFDKYVWKNKFNHIYYKRQNGWSLVLHQDINIYQDCMITIIIQKWLVIQMTPRYEEKALCFNKI